MRSVIFIVQGGRGEIISGRDNVEGKSGRSGTWRTFPLAKSGGVGSAVCAQGSVNFGICKGDEVCPLRNCPRENNPRTNLSPPPPNSVHSRGGGGVAIKRRILGSVILLSTLHWNDTV